MSDELDMSEMTTAEKHQMVAAAAMKLGEHLPAVQIMASWPCEGGGTTFSNYGQGNWFARKGMAQTFLERSKGRELTVAFQQEMEGTGDDD